MTVVNNDTLAIRDLSTELVYTIISDIFVSIALIIYLSYLQLDLLVVVLIIQPIMLVTQRFFNKKISSLSHEVRYHFGEMVALSQELISNALQFIVFGTKNFFLKKYRNNANSYCSKAVKLDLIRSIGLNMAALFSNISFLITLGLGGMKVILGSS